MNQNDELIDSLANSVCTKGLSAPAVFLLEMYKPLSGVLYNLTLVTFPVLNAVFGFDKLKELSEVLRSSEQVELLIQRIETLQNQAVQNEVEQKGLKQCRE